MENKSSVPLCFFYSIKRHYRQRRQETHPRSTPLLAETANGLANTSSPDGEEEEEEEGAPTSPDEAAAAAAETADPRAQVPGSVASSALTAADLSADGGTTGKEPRPLRLASRCSLRRLSSASRRQRARTEPPSSELRRILRPGRTTTPSAVSRVIFS